jgi:hypothetical protein
MGSKRIFTSQNEREREKTITWVLYWDDEEDPTLAQQRLVFGQPPTYTTMMDFILIIITVHGFVGLKKCVDVKKIYNNIMNPST